jgi:t-SNARE complex subunit (syntaxin)
MFLFEVLSQKRKNKIKDKTKNKIKTKTKTKLKNNVKKAFMKLIISFYNLFKYI